MLNGKICNTITKLGGLIVLIAFLSGCKKRLYDDPTVVTIKIENPITGEGYKNVTFKVQEYEDQNSGIHVLGSNAKETEDSPIYEGVTDENGYANFEFYKKKHSDFAYQLVLDYSKMEVPGGDYEIVAGGSGYNLSQHEFKHDVEVNILPYVNYYYHVKDTSYLASNDKMRYKVKEVYYLNSDQSFSDWGPNSQLSTGYYESCEDLFYNNGEPIHFPMQYSIIQKEVTRDGQIFNYLDTFLLDSKVTDTLKIYY